MKRRAFGALAGAAALTVALTACGSSGSSQGGTSSGSGSASGASTTSVASQLVFGGPSEFQTRPDGIPGLKSKYGIAFKNYRSLDAGGPLTVSALKTGTVQAADLFTTDPSIKANNFVALEDPKNNFAAQNILPLVNKSKATSGVTAVLNSVSAKLTTDTLSDLLTKVNTDKQDASKVASDWLSSAGISGGSAAGVTLTVGSANFTENVILANIYADALKNAGATIKTKFNIGSREAYIPGLKDGSIDLIPEYSGVLLQYFDKGATAVSSDDVYTALQKAVPSPLTVLKQSDAQDKDAVVVSKATADKYNLKSISDLANKP